MRIWHATVAFHGHPSTVHTFRARNLSSVLTALDGHLRDSGSQFVGIRITVEVGA